MSRFLERAFLERDPAAARDFYDEWAPTYETEITAHGYAAPARCAQALTAYVSDFTTPILDFGCGTGLAGQAFADAGFSAIDGVDISAAMLEQARKKELYGDLGTVAEETVPKGKYGIISAVGVISPGAAPGTTIDLLMHALPKGGKLVLSLNDYALADPQQAGRFNEWIDCGAACLLFADHGPHLTGRDMSSTVYVVEKY